MVLTNINTKFAEFIEEDVAQHFIDVLHFIYFIEKVFFDKLSHE